MSVREEAYLEQESGRGESDAQRRDRLGYNDPPERIATSDFSLMSLICGLCGFHTAWHEETESALAAILAHYEGEHSIGAQEIRVLIVQRRRPGRNQYPTSPALYRVDDPRIG